MIDLNRFGDDVILTTREVAEWIGCSAKSVIRMGVKPTPHRHRQHCYLASEIKRYLRGDRPIPRTMPLRRVS